ILLSDMPENSAVIGIAFALHRALVSTSDALYEIRVISILRRATPATWCSTPGITTTRITATGVATAVITAARVTTAVITTATIVTTATTGRRFGVIQLLDTGGTGPDIARTAVV